MFIAEIRGPQGKLTFQGMPNDDRTEAARYAFRNGPANAKVCSTSHAYRDPSGNWRSNGNDIRWHKRDDLFRDPPKPCDIGMFSDDAAQLDLIEAGLFRER